MIQLKRSALALAAAAIAGCQSGPPPYPPQPVLVTTVSPRCVSPVQCDQLWIRAQDAVSQVSGMRLRLVADGRMETFAPSTYGRLGGVVTKVMQEDGAYRMVARFECYRDNSQACENSKARAVNLFNMTLGPGEPMPAK